MSERRVVLSGTLKINSVTFGALGSYEQYIQSALVNAGFHVNAVRLAAAALNLATDLVGITLDLSVNTQYTAEQARQSALSVIESIPSDSYVFWGSPQFSNIDLSVLSDGVNTSIGSDQTRGLLDTSNINDAIKNVTGVSTSTIIWIVAAIFLAPYVLDSFGSRKR